MTTLQPTEEKETLSGGLQPMKPPSPNQAPQLQAIPGATPPKAAGSSPTLQDFVAEARRLGLEEYASTLPILRRQAEEAGNAVSRKLYGQNISPDGGLGQEVVSKALQPILENQAAIGNQISARLAGDAVNRYYQDTQQRNAQEQARAQDMLRRMEAGTYKPSADDVAFLGSQGYGGQVTPTAKVELANKYGKNPETGENFDSDFEAQTYVAKQNLAQRYGKNPATGQYFGSEQDALSYWDSQNFNQKVVQKYGISPTGKPWGSEQEALDYIEQKGYDKELARKYGFGPDGKPFTNEQDAIRYQEDKELLKLKGNISDQTIRDRISSKDEYYRYLDTGRTDEDQIAEIARNAKSLQQWQQALPYLEQASLWWDKKLTAEAAKGDNASKGQLDYLMLQKNQIDEWISQIKTGIAPTSSVSDIANSGQLQGYLQQTGNEQKFLTGVQPSGTPQSPGISLQPVGPAPLNTPQNFRAPVTTGDMGYGRIGPVFQSFADLQEAARQYERDPQAYVKAVGTDPFAGPFGYMDENGAMAIAGGGGNNVWKG